MKKVCLFSHMSGGGATSQGAEPYLSGCSSGSCGRLRLQPWWNTPSLLTLRTLGPDPYRPEDTDHLHRHHVKRVFPEFILEGSSSRMTSDLHQISPCTALQIVLCSYWAPRPAGGAVQVEEQQKENAPSLAEQLPTECAPYQLQEELQ